jgi:hypothetical protein
MPTLKIYDFECEYGHVFEAMVEGEQETLKCNVCSFNRASPVNVIAKRIMSPTRSSLDPLSFPTAEAKWIKAHESAGSLGERNR